MPCGAAVFGVPLLAGSSSVASATDRSSPAGCRCRRRHGLDRLIAQPQVAYRQMVAPLVLAGIGFAIPIPAIQHAVMNSVTPADIGKASPSSAR
jgi:hypothetical protein